MTWQAVAMLSVVVFVAVLAICGLMLWASTKIEPHWVSRDGRRLVCSGQGLTHRGEPCGRRRELRVTRMANGTVEVRPRHGSLARDGREAPSSSPVRAMSGAAGLGGAMFNRRQARASYWRVQGASPDPPPKRRVYLLDGSGDATMPDLLALRLPVSSRAIPMFEELAAGRDAEAVTPSAAEARTRGTPPPAAPPGPG